VKPSSTLKSSLQIVREIAGTSRMTQISLVILIFYIVVAITADFLVPKGYLATDVSRALQPPTTLHPLGTDYIGRDVLSMLFFGARSAFLVIATTQLFAFTVGVSIGMVSGYSGGRLDLLIMRATDVALAFPGIIMALAFAAIIGPGFYTAVFATALSQVAPYARFSRILTQGVKSQSYFDSAQVVGASASRVLVFHVFPNIRSPLMVQFVFASATAILWVASLSFLGVGAQPPSVDWGLMMFESRPYLTTHAELELIPGLMIALLILALNTMAEALRDHLDPHLRTQVL
jgi:peptide/nickel transport system permease protein